MSADAKDRKAERARPQKLLLVQPMMMKVVYALIPCWLASIALFGWRAAVLTLLVACFAVAAEAAFTYPRGKPVTSAVLVTSLIFSLSLPPTVPFWMAAVGIVFGVVFGKMVFGGFGYNIYNPAMVGRCFVYIAFPLALTGRWVSPFGHPLGGLLSWLPPVDGVSAATPLRVLRAGGDLALSQLVLGHTSGSLGETSAILIVLGGLFILYTRAASWKLTASCLLGGLLTATVFHFAGIDFMPTPLHHLVTGSFLFGAFFVVTEPISGPKTREGQWIYGFIIGSLIIVMRRYANFSEAVMFSVLFMNTFVSILDLTVKAVKQRNPSGSAP